MADVENVVVVRFETSKAYQALTVLKECDADGRIALQSAAIVERTPEESCASPRAPTMSVSSERRALADRHARRRPRRAGRCSGRLGAGALMGGVFDLDRAEKSDEALAALGRAMPPESTAVIATVSSPRSR